LAYAVTYLLADNDMKRHLAISRSSITVDSSSVLWYCWLGLL